MIEKFKISSFKDYFYLSNIEILIILFSLSAVTQLIYFYLLPLSYTIDSYQYILNNSEIRPPAYAWFLKLLGINIFKNSILVISFQMILIAAIPVLVFQTVVKSGKISAIIAAVLSMFYGYMYTMSVQVMSESLFIFGCVLTVYLISLYHSKQKTYLLVITCLCLILTSEIRQSSVPLFGGIFLMILLMLIKLRKIKFLIHSFLVLGVFLSYSSIRTLFIDKNGFDLMPFFMVHWMPDINTSNWEISGDKVEFSPRIIDKNNGEKGQELAEYMKKLFTERDDIYVVMSSLRTNAGGVYKQRPEFKIYNDENINKLVDDILYNRKYNAHRWPHLVNLLWEAYGVEKTSDLLHGAIIEGLIKNPTFFKNFYIPQLQRTIKSGQALHDNVYWWFIPSRETSVSILDQFPLGGSAYASWLYSLEDKTGKDPLAKKGEGGVLAYTPLLNKKINLDTLSKLSNKNPFESYKELNNYTAPAIYIGSLLTRALAILYLLSLPFIVVFSLFCKQKEIVIPIIGSITLIIAISFLAQPYPRQIFIHMPLLFAVFGMGLAGFNESVSKFTKSINNKLK